MSQRYCTKCGSKEEALARQCSRCGADLPVRKRWHAQQSEPNVLSSSDTNRQRVGGRPRKKTMVGVSPFAEASEDKPPAPRKRKQTMLGVSSFVEAPPPAEASEDKPPAPRKRKQTMLGVPSFAEASPPAVVSEDSPEGEPSFGRGLDSKPPRARKPTILGVAPQSCSPPTVEQSATLPSSMPLQITTPSTASDQERPSYRSRVHVHFETGYTPPPPPMPWYRTYRGIIAIVAGLCLVIVAAIEFFS